MPAFLHPKHSHSFYSEFFFYSVSHRFSLIAHDSFYTYLFRKVFIWSDLVIEVGVFAVYDPQRRVRIILFGSSKYFTAFMTLNHFINSCAVVLNHTNTVSECTEAGSGLQSSFLWFLPSAEIIFLFLSCDLKEDFLFSWRDNTKTQAGVTICL